MLKNIYIFFFFKLKEVNEKYDRKMHNKNNVLL